MKTSRIIRAFGAALLCSTGLLALAPSAQAVEPAFPNLLYNVTLNLSSLVGNTDGPYSLDFQLATGSGNVINSVSLSQFVFTGGSSTGTDFSTGGVTGSAPGGITLTNSSLVDNETAFALSPGVTQVSFLVSETPNSEVVSNGTPIPDQFNIALLNNASLGENNILTTDPSGNNELVSSTISSNETVASVKTFTSLSPDAGVSVVVTAPEPSTYAMLLSGLVALGMVALRRRQA